jgi:Tol biopolymer transport system component
MAADGMGLRQLTNGAVSSQPTFSPDGVKIAYRRLENGPRDGIWVMNADGSDQRLLASGSFLRSRLVPR